MDDTLRPFVSAHLKLHCSSSRGSVFSAFWLHAGRVCVCVCVCERERERKGFMNCFRVLGQVFRARVAMRFRVVVGVDVWDAASS